MSQSVEQVVYGNPTREQLELMQRVTPYDYLLPKMFETVCPSNISTFIQDELRTLVEYQKEYNFLSEAVKKRYAAYDYNLPKAIINYISNRYNLDTANLVDEIIRTTLPIILKLKYKYQRPRPYTVAYYYKQSVFPLTTESAISPSFPSGHSFQATLIQETLGNLYPEIYNDLKKLTADICEQRLFYGVHFPSDLDNGIMFAKMITTSKEWTTKHNI